MKDLANLDLGRLGFTLNFAQADDVRRYLSGVRVEPHPKEGVVMVATDGRALAMAHDPEGSVSQPVTIRPTELSKLPRYYGEARIGLRKVDGGLVGSVTTRGETLGRHLFDDLGDFYPDWRKVVPWSSATAPAGTPGVFDFALLSRFTFPAPGRKKTEPVPLTIRGGGRGEPALVTRCDMPWFLGVVMPMRSEAEVPTSLLALA